MCGIWSYISKNENIDLIQTITSFLSIKNRGPETSTLTLIRNIAIGFHRLAIHGLSGISNQPFVKDNIESTIYSICNGEIYNYLNIISQFKLNITSKSDCEVLPFLYQKFNEEMIQHLDGEFAFAIVTIDQKSNHWKLFCGRDPYGVRPLFFGNDVNGFCIGSEIKSIVHLNDHVDVFPPGYTLTIDSTDWILKWNKFYQPVLTEILLDETKIYQKIRNKFEDVVKKRLSSDRKIGCLLSGGLDSSIVSAVTSNLIKQHDKESQIQTFTIGLSGATDIDYAEQVAQHIGSDHRTFVITIDEALEAIEQVIYHIESYDCTTVRASIWQYLLGKKIKEHTDIKVLLTGEGSDELMSGYLYFHNAPDESQSHLENVRLLSDIHRFDGLRVDRAMSCHGLEVRIPFLDPEFVELYLSLPKNLRMASRGIEKQLFRNSFKETNLLPWNVLYRKKEAFSDGTSSKEKSWFRILQEHIDKMISDEEFANKSSNDEDTKEKYYYKKIFRRHFGGKCDHVIPYYWLPKWCGNITEPSARVLDVYHV